MKEELYIINKGQRLSLDLPSPSGITLKWVNNLFNDLSKLTCSYSYTFKLPMTATNRRVFELAEDIRRESSFCGKRVSAEFILNGVSVCPNANLYISETGASTYSCVMTWGVLKAFQKLKDDNTKLNELGSVGTCVWQNNSMTNIIGMPTKNLTNTQDVVYLDYDAGCPHYDNRPPKPCMPVYRIIQLINKKYGVKFDIGRALSEGFSALPLADFNNKNYHEERVYDDYITHGVVPLTNTSIVSKESGESASASTEQMTQPDGRPLTTEIIYLEKDSGWRWWELAELYEYDQVGELVATYTAVVGLQKGQQPLPEVGITYVGIACLEQLQTTGEVEPLFAHYIVSIGDDKPNYKYNYDQWIAEGKVPAQKFEDVLYEDFAETLFSNDGLKKNNYDLSQDLVGYRCRYAHEVRGGMDVYISKQAVDEGRVKLEDYWWIALVKANYDGTVEVVSDKDVGNWLGLQSVSGYTYDESIRCYVYHFDFGSAYDVRRLKIDELDERETEYAGYFIVPYYPDDDLEPGQSILQRGDIESYGLHFDDIGAQIEFTELPATIDIIKSLPDISCFDFMKSIFYMSGALPCVDKDEKITAIYYDQLRDNVYDGKAVDWSQRVIGVRTAQSESIKFSLSQFGKHNYFEMANSQREKTQIELNDELDVYEQGYGELTLGSELSTDEKSIYKSPFYSPQLQDRQYPLVMVGHTTKIWNDKGEYTDNANPIYGLAVYRALDPSFEDMEKAEERFIVWQKGSDFKHFRMNAYNPFKNVKNTFSYLNKILQDIKVVKEKLNLRETDIADLNMAMPVYLHKHNAFFAIITLQRDSKGIYTAELIKLPYVVPTYPEAESSYTKIVPSGEGGGDTPVTPDEPITPPEDGMEYITDNYFADITIAMNGVKGNGKLIYGIRQDRGYDEFETPGTGLGLPCNMVYKDVDEYIPNYIRPKQDGWSKAYTLELDFYEEIPYTLKWWDGDTVVHEHSAYAPLRAWFDDEEISEKRVVKTFSLSERRDYHIIRMAADITDERGEVVMQYRKKIYYFVYEPDDSVITDDWDFNE